MKQREDHNGHFLSEATVVQQLRTNEYRMMRQRVDGHHGKVDVEVQTIVAEIRPTAERTGDGGFDRLGCLFRERQSADLRKLPHETLMQGGLERVSVDACVDERSHEHGRFALAHLEQTFRDHACHLLDVTYGHRNENGLAAGEILIERAHADAGAARHLGHRDSIPLPFCQELSGCLDDGITGGVRTLLKRASPRRNPGLARCATRHGRT